MPEKRGLIDAELEKRDMVHHTRKRDVFFSVATAGTIGVLGLGLAPVGSEMLGAIAGEKWNMPFLT
jgi:hypothetical protein